MPTLLSIGDVIELKEGHKVYADVPEHFLYANRRGVFTLAKGEVTIKGELSYLAGRYVVIHTALDGGNDPSSRDHFPNGHHVLCKRLSDNVCVDFYQTGCFTAMITDIEPVGKAVNSGWAEVK